MQKAAERLAFVEGRVSELSSAVDGLRHGIAGVDQRVAALEVRMDQRFSTVDQRLATLDATMDRRFSEVDAKMSLEFLWMLGVQITIFAAMIGTILTAFFAR